ncbi:MAG: SHOCT domain-containing protein [Clostridia bacterium]|nr:SHOCT domain-containing protein [Clostridia bacterium]
MHMSAKKIVLCCLAFVIAIMTIAGPAFYLFRINPDEPVTVPDDMDVPNYVYENAGNGETGFDFFSFESDFLVGTPDVEEIGAISIIQLCIGIIGFLLVLAALIFCRTNLAQSLCSAAVILGLIICAAYALIGVLFTVRLLNVTFVGLYLNFYTLSYIPFAIVAVFSLAFVLVANLMPSSDDKKSKEEKQLAREARKAARQLATTTDMTGSPVLRPVSTAPAMNHEEITSLLSTYKQLLDDGIITQEEFESKKRNVISC